jgi:hypothetical protein
MVDTTLLKELLGALVVYVLLIINTHRKGYGLSPYPWPLITPDAPLESPYKEEWGFITWQTGWFAQPSLPLFYQVEL